MPEALAIFGHGIGGTLDIVEESKIVEVALMQTRDAKKVGGWLSHSSRTFAVPDNSRDVVAKASGGKLVAVHFLHHEVLMG
jgi:hypothetical protein